MARNDTELAWRSLAAWLLVRAPRSPPSFTPRRLAAASAAFVHSLISATLVLGHHRHDGDRQSVGLRHVGCHEIVL
jgi:hypothetical protein